MLLDPSVTYLAGCSVQRRQNCHHGASTFARAKIPQPASPKPARRRSDERHHHRRAVEQPVRPPLSASGRGVAGLPPTAVQDALRRGAIQIPSLRWLGRREFADGRVHERRAGEYGELPAESTGDLQCRWSPKCIRRQPFLEPGACRIRPASENGCRAHPASRRSNQVILVENWLDQIDSAPDGARESRTDHVTGVFAVGLKTCGLSGQGGVTAHVRRRAGGRKDAHGRVHEPRAAKDRWVPGEGAG